MFHLSPASYRVDSKGAGVEVEIANHDGGMIYLQQWYETIRYGDLTMKEGYVSHQKVGLNQDYQNVTRL